MYEFRLALFKRCVTPTAFMRDWDDVTGAEAELIDQCRHGHVFAAYDATASHSGDGILNADRPSLAR
jgi:hypothetical protein